MADLPPDNDDTARDLPESPFLIRLWMHLNAADDLAIRPDVLEHLDEIAAHCQAVIDEIASWRDGQAR
jgi:hypothetical protein